MFDAPRCVGVQASLALLSSFDVVADDSCSLRRKRYLLLSSSTYECLRIKWAEIGSDHSYPIPWVRTAKGSLAAGLVLSPGGTYHIAMDRAEPRKPVAASLQPTFRNTPLCFKQNPITRTRTSSTAGKLPIPISRRRTDTKETYGVILTVAPPTWVSVSTDSNGLQLAAAKRLSFAGRDVGALSHVAGLCYSTNLCKRTCQGLGRDGTDSTMPSRPTVSLHLTCALACGAKRQHASCPSCHRIASVGLRQGRAPGSTPWMTTMAGLWRRCVGAGWCCAVLYAARRAP